MRCLRLLFVAAVTLAYSLPALAIGEIVRDVAVRNAVRTSEDTVRTMAGISIGDTLEATTLETVRERLNTVGIFQDVNVFWEPHGDGVRVVIVITEKFPWAPLPTFSKSPGNTSFGLVVVHGNLFGRGKQGLIGGRVSSADSGAVLAYRDPALFGTWMYFQVQAKFQDQIIPEYTNFEGLRTPDMQNLQLFPLRETKLRAFAFDGNMGVAWFRRVKTQVGWHLERTKVLESTQNAGLLLPETLGPAAQSATVGYGQANLIFDFRAREHAVLTGNALSLGLLLANSDWGSDAKIRYWKANLNYEHGIRFFRRHNLIYKGGTNIGSHLPLWAENYSGGTNLRGFLYQQFRGNTEVYAGVEYHFPLFSIKQLDFRALGFYDTTAVWYRNLPPENGLMYIPRSDGRNFLPPQYLQPGFKFDRDIHNSVGGGLRFFLRSVAVPLVGLDYGYGIESKTWRLILIVGA